MSAAAAWLLIGRKDGSSSSRRQRRFATLGDVERAIVRWRRDGFNTWWIFHAGGGPLYRQWTDLDRLRAVHAPNCQSESCRGCFKCYQLTGDTVCDRMCKHTIGENFSEREHDRAFAAQDGDRPAP